ncbi:unnamed protein product [Closterium sp. NIES-53]
MFITLYLIVTRLPDSLRSVRDQFLSLDPTSLTVDLLEQNLLAAETSAVVVGAPRGSLRPPFFEGCSPSPLAPSYASAAAVDISVAEDIGAASASAKRRISKGKGGKGGGGGSGGGGGGSGSGGGGSGGGGGGSGGGGGGGTVGGSGGSGGSGGGSGGSGGSGGGGTGSGGTGARRVGSGGGQRQQQQRRSETLSPQLLHEWFLRGASGGRIAIFDIDFDAIISAMYALSVSAEGDCYRCVPPDPGIAATALGASESGTLPGTAPAQALHTFTLVSGASRCFFRDSTTLTPLSALVPVRLADPSWGPVVARSSTVLPCPTVSSGSLSVLHLPSFSTNLVSTAALQDAMVTTTTPVGQRVSICTCTRTGRHLATFTYWPGLFCGTTIWVTPPCLAFVARTLSSSCLWPPQGPAPSGVSQADPLPGTAPVQVAVDSGAARGAASGGVEPGGAESEGAETGGAEPGGVEPGGAEPRGVANGGGEPEGAEPGGAASEGAESGGAEPRGAALSRVELLELEVLALLELEVLELLLDLVLLELLRHTGPGGARTRGTGTAGTGGVEGAGARAPTEPGAAGAGGTSAGSAGAGGAGATGVGAVDPRARGPGDIVRPRPYFVPLLQQVLGVKSSTGLTPPLMCPPPDKSQLPLQPAAPLPAPSPYTEQSGGLIERREPASCPISHPPPVPGTHAMALRPSFVPLRVPLPSPPASSLREVPDPESDRARAASPTVARLLATAVTDPSFESAVASALVAELLEFPGACRLDYVSALVAESASASPPSVGGECALGTDVLEDRQEDFACLAAAIPRFASMLLAPEGDPDAPDIPTPRSYAEAITGPYSFQWQAAMDAEMASWKSTGTYVDEVPSPGANIVDGMWIFREVDYFQTFSHTAKMTTLRLLLHIAAQRDYELHSLDFSTAFLQGSLHEEIWLRRPPGFTESFPAGTQWSLQRPVYGLRQVPREWHDTLRTTLAALGFAPATADPSLFLRTDTLLPPFYVLVYITRDTAWLTITLTWSHMVHQVLQRFGFQFSSPQPTPLSTSHSLSAPPSDESVELSGPYPELVGCLMYLMTCTRPNLAYPLSLLARYVAPGRHRKVHCDAAKRVLRYLCSTSSMGLVLGGRGLVVLTGHAEVSWFDDSAMQQTSQGDTFSFGSGSVSWWSTRSSSVLNSSCEAEIYAGAMAAQELRWLTYLLTDLGEQPRSPPVLAVAVGAARGTPRPPFFEGCTPSPLAPSYASAATADVPAASAIGKRHSTKGKGGRGGGGGSGGGGGGSSGGSGGRGGGGSGGSGGGSGGSGGGSGGNGGSGGSGSGGTGGGRTGAQRGASEGGQRQQQQRRSEAQSPQQLRKWLFQRGTSRGSGSRRMSFTRVTVLVERPRWADLLRSGVAIFDLDFDAILTAMYALSVSAEGDYYRCVPPDPCIAPAALSASESALPGTAPAEALHTFMLDSSASGFSFVTAPPSLLTLHLSWSD